MKKSTFYVVVKVIIFGLVMGIAILATSGCYPWGIDLFVQGV